MMSGISEPNVPWDKPLSTIDPSQQQPQRWRTKTFLIVFAAIVTAIWGSVWWSNLLSSEERACLGRWVAIDTATDKLPNGSSSLTFYRELHFLSGHEVHLRVWAEGDPERVKMVPAFGGRACVYPLMGDSSRIITTTPHPAVSPDSVVNVLPPAVNVKGQ